MPRLFALKVLLLLRQVAGTVLLPKVAEATLVVLLHNKEAVMDTATGTVRVFRQRFRLRGCHWFPPARLKLLHACDQ
jgi:hypothetical protein